MNFCAAFTYFTVDHHYVEGCRIGHKRDRMAVVDNRLRVLGGVRGLRIADASIIPFVRSGNTNAPSFAIGERAADIIKEDNKVAVLKPKLPYGCNVAVKKIDSGSLLYYYFQYFLNLHALHEILRYF